MRYSTLPVILVAIWMNSLQAYEFKADFRSIPPDLVYEKNQASGAIVKIVELALQRAGHTVRWDFVPWKRTQYYAKYGRNDILVRHSMNDQRRLYLAPLLMGYEERKLLFLSTSSSTVSIKNFQDLAKYSIGQVRGNFYSKEYNNAQNLNRTVVESYSQLVPMLKAGRIDVVAVVANNTKALELFKEISGLRVAEFRMSFLNGRYCSIPFLSPAIKFYKEVNAEFYKMRLSGELNKIMIEHGGHPYKQNYSSEESLLQAISAQ